MRKAGGRLVYSALVSPAKAGSLEFEASRQIAQIRACLRLSWAEAGALFGVTGQAVQQWLERGVPIGRVADVDRIAEAVEGLTLRFKPARLPSIVRSPLPILDQQTILEAIRADGVASIFEMFRRWASYVPR